MIEKKVTIVNKKGIHARPASKIVELASTFSATIEIVRDNDVINAKSIIGILTLGAICGTELMLRVSGDDEADAAEQLTHLFASGFK